MRGFYRARVNVFAGRAPDTPTPATFGCITLFRAAQFYYLHSESNPNVALEDAGGTLLSDTWEDLRPTLPAQAQNRVFWKRVRRVVGGRTVTINVGRDDTDPSDVVEDDWVPPHKFAGDAEPVPLP